MGKMKDLAITLQEMSKGDDYILELSSVIFSTMISKGMPRVSKAYQNAVLVWREYVENHDE